MKINTIKSFKIKLIFTLIISMITLSACSTQESIEQHSPVQTNDSIGNEKTQAETADTDEDSEEFVSEAFSAEPGLYDRTYLKQSNGKYVYSLTDESIIQKYDELYASAFQDVVDNYNEIMEYQNQGYDFSKPVTITPLVLKNTNATGFINVGSYFEMDYGFDLNNVGYTYVDLDSDGTFELIFGVLSESREEWMPRDYFERAYALVDNKPVRFIEGGSRILFWLGDDGAIYETGSGGASYNGMWKRHFDSTSLDSEWGGWEETGLIDDEFLGVWDEYVYIKDLSIDISNAAKLPENQISEDELHALYDEWESRHVDIDWFKLSDYLSTYNIYEL